MRDFVTSRPALKEILKVVFKAKQNDPHGNMKIQECLHKDQKDKYNSVFLTGKKT